jgi:hypothetical protein
MTDYRALQATIRSLEATLAAPGERIRRVLSRRLAIAHKRVECWGKARENLELITHELATILELVQLVHEQSIVPADARKVCDDVDRLLADIEDNEGVGREIEGIASEDGVELLEELEALPAGNALVACRR